MQQYCQFPLLHTHQYHSDFFIIVQKKIQSAFFGVRIFTQVRLKLTKFLKPNPNWNEVSPLIYGAAGITGQTLN